MKAALAALGLLVGVGALVVAASDSHAGPPPPPPPRPGPFPPGPLPFPPPAPPQGFPGIPQFPPGTGDKDPGASSDPGDGGFFIPGFGTVSAPGGIPQFTPDDAATGYGYVPWSHRTYPYWR